MDNTNTRIFSLSTLVLDFNLKNKHKINSDDGSSTESNLLQRKIRDIHSVKKNGKVLKPNNEKVKGSTKNIKISDISSMTLLRKTDGNNKKRKGLIMSEFGKNHHLAGTRYYETNLAAKQMIVPNNNENDTLSHTAVAIKDYSIDNDEAQDYKKNKDRSIDDTGKRIKKIRLADIIASNISSQNKKSINEIKDIKGLNNFQLNQQFLSLQMKLFPVHLIFNDVQLGSSLLEQTYDYFCKLNQDQERLEYNDKQTMTAYSICKIEKLNEFIYRIITTEKNENEKKYLLNLKQPQEMARMNMKKVRIDERFRLRLGNKEYFYCWQIETSA